MDSPLQYGRRHIGTCATLQVESFRFRGSTGALLQVTLRSPHSSIALVAKGEDSK